MAHLLLQQEFARPSSAPPKDTPQAQDQETQERLLAIQSMLLGTKLGEAPRHQQLGGVQGLDQRLTSSFTSMPPLQSVNSEQHTGTQSGDNAYISYWHSNKNLNPRLPSPWLDGTDEVERSGIGLDSLKDSLRDMMEQAASGMNSPSRLQEQNSLNSLSGKLRLGSSAALGSSSAPLGELTGRHHSFTAGHDIWSQRPTPASLGVVDKQQGGNSLLMQLQEQSSLNGKLRIGGSSVTLGTGGSGSPLAELTSRHHSFTAGHDIWSQRPNLAGLEKPQQSQPQGGGNALLQDPVRLGLLSSSFPSSRHRAAPSKLRIGSTAQDSLTFSSDAAGSPAAQVHGVPEASQLPSLSPNLAAEVEADAAGGPHPAHQASATSLTSGGAGSTSDPSAVAPLLRDAAAAAGPEAEAAQAAMYLQAMAATVYGGAPLGYPDPNMAGNPFGAAAGGHHGGPYPMHMQPYGAAAGAPGGFPGLDAAAATAAGMMGLPTAHLDPAMAAASMGLQGMRPGQMPMPFPGLPFPTVSPAEYAAYYQRCMESQALMAAAAMGMAPMGNMPLVPGMLLPDSPFGGMPMAGAAGGHLDPSGPRGRAPGSGHSESPYMHHGGHMVHHAGHAEGGPMGMRGDDPLSARALERLQGGGGHGSRRNSRRDTEMPASTRGSAVLEEFKANKTRKYELQDIQGHMCEFALDQHGSRFIQQKLEGASEEELGVVLGEVLPRITHLMTDVFGNYVVQKLLEHGTPAQRNTLAETLKGQVLALSLQMYGCRVVQKALEVLPVDTQCALVAELDGNVMRCVRDQNGNHVIQKVIECVPTPRITALLDNFMGCVLQLSSHPFGCRIMQRILEHCSDNERRGNVMRDILSNAHPLAQDQYGNYVIQHVLEHGAPADRAAIATSLTPHVVPLSTHKFASNVVEKALVHCAFPERDAIIRAILGSGAASGASTPHAAGAEEGGGSNGSLPHVQGGGVSVEGEGAVEGGSAGGLAAEQGGAGMAAEDALQTMMHDQYGNYVVQKVLEVCDDTQREYLLGRVRAQLHLLKKYTYGKHIVARVEKLLLSGTKIQTHLRARPLPNDTQPLSALASRGAPGTSPKLVLTESASPGSTKVETKGDTLGAFGTKSEPRSGFGTAVSSSSGSATTQHHEGEGGNHCPYPAVPAPMAPLPPRASDSASPPPAEV